MGRHLIYSKFSRSLLGCAALIKLGNEAIGAWHSLGGAASDVISEQALLRAVLPLGQQNGVQQAAKLAKFIIFSVAIC